MGTGLRPAVLSELLRIGDILAHMENRSTNLITSDPYPRTVTITIVIMPATSRRSRSISTSDRDGELMSSDREPPKGGSSDEVPCVAVTGGSS